jgi:hypothetical protein
MRFLAFLQGKAATLKNSLSCDCSVGVSAGTGSDSGAEAWADQRAGVFLVCAFLRAAP